MDIEAARIGGLPPSGSVRGFGFAFLPRLARREVLHSRLQGVHPFDHLPSPIFLALLVECFNHLHELNAVSCRLVSRVDRGRYGQSARWPSNRSPPARESSPQTDPLPVSAKSRETRYSNHSWDLQ